jgi:chromosome segregation ATPase
MPNSTKKTNKSVTFSPETADQTLLEAIEQALSEEQYDSFSDLCKQALQQTLLAAQAAPVKEDVDLAILLAPLQQQIAQLEANVLVSQSQRLDELNQQLVQTSQQLAELNRQGDRAFAELLAQIAELQPAVDPTDHRDPELMQLLQALAQGHSDLQQQVEAVQRQFASWKQPASHQTTEYLNHLTSQLVHLTTQVETIESKITQQFADLQSQLEQSQITSANPRLVAPMPLPAEAIAPAPNEYEPIPIFKETSPRTPVVVPAPESDPILRRLSSLLEDF